MRTLIDPGARRAILDAVYIARKAPAVPIFCPWHGGINHNEAESITPAWAEAGLRALAEAMLATAGIARR